MVSMGSLAKQFAASATSSYGTSSSSPPAKRRPGTPGGSKPLDDITNKAQTSPPRKLPAGSRSHQVSTLAAMAHAGVHTGSSFVTGIDNFPHLGDDLCMTDGTIFHVMFDVQKAPDGSIIVVDQRAEFIKARLGMGVFWPQVGRLGKTGGVFRIDMTPVSATEPHPNVVKMRKYAAAHPRSAEAKVQELERRWDADPLLKRSRHG